MYGFEYWLLGISLLTYTLSATQLYRLSKRRPVVADQKLDGWAIVGLMISTIIILSLIFAQVGQLGNIIQAMLFVVEVCASVSILLSPFYLVIRARTRYDKETDS